MSTTSGRLGGPKGRRWADIVVVTSGLATAASLGAVTAYLVATGKVVLALAVLLAVPIGYLVVKHPLSVIAIWLAFTPFLVTTEGGSIRKAYWVVHRAIPVAALGVITAQVLLRDDTRRLPRLGWPEWAMAGYVGVSVLSILHTSDAAVATLFHLFDRVVVPMCLYLLVRLAPPGERELRRVIPVIAFLLVSQAVFGIASWVAPDVLPRAWLGRVGLRTTGSLGHPNVYGTTLLFAGVVLLHYGLIRPRGGVPRWLLRAGYPIALLMVFMTYSRASWLAALIVSIGLIALHPRHMAKILVVGALLIATLLGSGIVDGQIEMALRRFRSEQSEESALSRLPVALASLRMLQEKPVQGWGYGNFDAVSAEFQGSVDGVFVPDKEHASHNLYLTLLAEQGVTGFLLYLGPAALLLVASAGAWNHLPATGLRSRRLVGALWLVLAAHVVVNMYSNMRVVFGLGLWWLVLGVIASVVLEHRRAPQSARTSQRPVDDREQGVGAGSLTSRA